MTLFQKPILVLDTETTGLPYQTWAGVCEVAAVLLGPDGEEAATFESLVRPPVLDARCDGALAVNNIDPADLRTAPEPKEVAAAFYRWLEPLGGPYWTTFNIDFDKPMLFRAGLVSERWASCVMRRACDVMGPLGLLRAADPTHRNYDPARPWLYPKLSLAAEHFGVVVDGAPHRALTDARTAAGIAIAIQRAKP